MISLLVTGSIRNPDETRQVIETCLKVKEKYSVEIDQIIFSSTENLSMVEDFFHLNEYAQKIIVVVSPEPTIISTGHRHHQLTQLSEGLKRIPDANWVIKMRTDKLILQEAHISSFVEQIIHGQIPENKFGILEGLLFMPWYINDMAFVATKQRMLTLCNFNDLADSLAPNLMTEQVIWSSILSNQEKIYFYVRASQDNAISLSDVDQREPDFSLDKELLDIKDILLLYWNHLRTSFHMIDVQDHGGKYDLVVLGTRINTQHLFTRNGTWATHFRNLDQIDFLIDLLNNKS